MIFRSIPLGWLQLKHQKLRLLAATLGITFAVVLIFVQLEFREALFVSAVRYHSAMEYDLVLLSPKTDFMVASKSFPRNRLYQALGFSEVESVTPVYMRLATWRHPVEPTRSRNIFAIGFDPVDQGFRRLLSEEQHEQLKIPYQVVFDRLSRSEYGPVPQLMAEHGAVETEINDNAFTVTGLFSIGTSFGLDGGVITSDLNFIRMFPDRRKSSIELGLVQLAPGADQVEVQLKVLAALPDDVRVLTRAEFAQMEIDHWNTTTPIGYIFAFGAIMGLVVGSIIVYQILFSDVTDHLKEYATLKAMGYTQGYLRNVVLQEAVVLALLGFLPGMGLSILAFDQAAAATRLPLDMTRDSALQVFVLTLVMCAGSGLLALRKLRSVDPADVF